MKHPTRLVNDLAIAGHYIYLRMAPEDLDNSRNGARLVSVVGVYPGQNVPSGALPASVDGVGLAVVPFANPIGKPVCVLADDFNAAVCGAAVKDQILDVRIVLMDY
jgi:hypothetical protein